MGLPGVWPRPSTLWWLDLPKRLVEAVMIKCNIPLAGERLLEPYTNTIGKDYLIWVFILEDADQALCWPLWLGGSSPSKCQHEHVVMQEQQLWLRSPPWVMVSSDPHPLLTFGFNSSLALSAQRSVRRLLSIYLFNIVKAKLDIFCLKNLVPKSVFLNQVHAYQNLKSECSVFLAKSVSIIFYSMSSNMSFEPFQ